MGGTDNGLVQDPGRVADLAAALRAGDLTPRALVDRYLARITAVDDRVAAWREVDADRARAEADRLTEEAKAGQWRGPLHGIPVGIKDIIDVAGLPTRCNSAARADAPPATADAEVVAALRAAGAIILGKVHTTEFAYYDPSPACNPHNPAHTPGGSSSGSAAAVAAGTVPLALGTQTMASVNRPAAYCGIAAFKPSTRLPSPVGVAPLAPYFDTVGCYGWSVADAVAAFRALQPPFMALAEPSPSNGPLRVVVLRDPFLDQATGAVTAATKAAVDALAAAGHGIVVADNPLSAEDIFARHTTVLEYELARTLEALAKTSPNLVGAKLMEAIARGLETTSETYLRGRAGLDAERARFFAAFPDADAFLWPATPDAAPEGLAWTGDPRFISQWTVLGGPVVTAPVGLTAAGLPLGVLLAGHPGSDARFGDQAIRLAEALDGLRERRHG